jgi:murein L,D-transpeptidase YcbB/YkuD
MAGSFIVFEPPKSSTQEAYQRGTVAGGWWLVAGAGGWLDMRRSTIEKVLKALVAGLAILAIAPVLAGATPTKSTKHRHRSTAVATSPAKKGAKTSAKKTAGKKGKSSRHPSRSYQQAPSQERYMEIQRALASKGYLKSEPNGEWGPDSVDALKRFQTDQSLTPDGKIGSLSLIALGLGPKRMTAKSDSPTGAAAPAPPQ